MALATERDDFEALTLTYLDVLYSVGMSLTRDPDEAQDLVQETRAHMDDKTVEARLERDVNLLKFDMMIQPASTT